MKRLDWFIARHYLRSGRGKGLLSLITLIALGGVTVGVAALIIVIAVMTGMQADLRAKILESSPHITVLEIGSSLRLRDYDRVIDSIKASPEVVAAAPFGLGQVTLVAQQAGERYSQSAYLFGVSVDDHTSVTGMEEQIAAGALDLNATESGLPPILLGSVLAERMLVFEGDTLTVMSMENYQLGVGGITPNIRRYEVSGTFTTGMYEYDLSNVYVRFEDSQDLLGIDHGTASGVEVRTTDEDVALAIADDLEERLGLNYVVQSWDERNMALFNALKLEKLAMGLAVFLIVIVAAFNIVGTLVMVVADRTREIGILKTMGMTRGGILRVFVLQGAWIGIVGTTAGVSLGVAIAWAVDRFQLIRLPGDVYFVDYLPAIIDPVDISMIVVASLAVSFGATVYPALQASRLEPVDAIRHD